MALKSKQFSSYTLCLLTTSLSALATACNMLQSSGVEQLGSVRRFKTAQRQFKSIFQTVRNDETHKQHRREKVKLRARYTRIVSSRDASRHEVRAEIYRKYRATDYVRLGVFYGCIKSGSIEQKRAKVDLATEPFA